MIARLVASKIGISPVMTNSVLSVALLMTNREGCFVWTSVHKDCMAVLQGMLVVKPTQEELSHEIHAYLSQHSIIRDIQDVSVIQDVLVPVEALLSRKSASKQGSCSRSMICKFVTHTITAADSAQSSVAK